MDPRWEGDPRNAFAPDWEAGMARVTSHEVDRVSRLKALGNSICPQVAYELLLALLAVDDGEQGAR